MLLVRSYGNLSVRRLPQNRLSWRLAQDRDMLAPIVAAEAREA
jgi:hypothetical protein